MLRKLIVLFFGFILPAAAQTIAIRAGNLIEPAKGTVSKDQIILVENGKITAVGAGLAIPKDAQVVDLSKEWVMPGLMDAHTHITFQEIPGKAPFEAMYLKEGSPFRALRGLHTGQILLNAGFTTMREVGNEADYACSDLKKAIHAGWFDGPTLQCAGKIIGPFGGQSKGMPEEVTQNFIKQIPLGRLGEAHEIVDAALFLASPMASYITGHVLNVNGGFYLG